MDERLEDEEASWIHGHIANGMNSLFGNASGQDLSVTKGDILRFLDLVHVQKLDVSSLLSFISLSILIYTCLF